MALKPGPTELHWQVLKIIDIRLDHVTEDYGLIDDAQEGFRQGRSYGVVPSANWLNCTAC